jgi:hypothetical protein
MRMKIFYLLMIGMVLSVIALTASPCSAQSAKATPQAKQGAQPPIPKIAADTTKAPDSAAAADPAMAQWQSAADEFMRKYGKDAADSLDIRLRDDYMLCTGDETRISRAQLFRWKAYIDSMVMDKSYAQKFKTYVSTTSLKAHEVRPCEPIVFHDRLEKQIHEMDSIISAQRAAKEKAYKDSATVANELKHLKHNPADILNIPAGMSRHAAQIILANNKIRVTNMPRHLQADRVMLDSLIVTIAFYFDGDDKYTGYEVETRALPADQLDGTVRAWAHKLSAAYEKRLGRPDHVNRVSFRDIKQGNLSIISKWEKSAHKPRVLVGLATHNHLYYAKVMVNY